jgi:hypothetical protein
LFGPTDFTSFFTILEAEAESLDSDEDVFVFTIFFVMTLRVASAQYKATQVSTVNSLMQLACQ